MRRLAAVLVVFALAAPARADESWEEPKDGVLTEKQADGYLLVLGRAVKRWKDLSKDAEKKQLTAAEALAKLRMLEEKNAQDLKDAGLGPNEHDWVKRTFTDTYWAIVGEKLRSDILDKTEKEYADKVAAAEKRLADAEARKRSGKKKLSEEEKKLAIESAQADAKAADDEATDAQRRVDEAKAALKDANGAVSEAKKSGDADAIKAAEDARAQAEAAVGEAEKAVKDAKDRAAAARARAKDPEAPANDEERKVLADALEQERADAAAELKSVKEAAAQLAKLQKDARDQTAQELAKLPPQNLKIVRARYDKMNEALGILGATIPK